jgi:hypothetical protein
MKRPNRHIGSDFDDFLKEEGILEEAQAVAAKRVIAFQIKKAMKEKYLEIKNDNENAYKKSYAIK